MTYTTIIFTLDQAHGSETVTVKLGPGASLSVVDAVALNDAGEPAGTYIHTGIPFSEIVSIELGTDDAAPPVAPDVAAPAGLSPGQWMADVLAAPVAPVDAAPADPAPAADAPVAPVEPAPAAEPAPVDSGHDQAVTAAADAVIAIDSAPPADKAALLAAAQADVAAALDTYPDSPALLDAKAQLDQLAAE